MKIFFCLEETRSAFSQDSSVLNERYMFFLDLLFLLCASWYNYSHKLVHTMLSFIGRLSKRTRQQRGLPRVAQINLHIIVQPAKTCFVLLCAATILFLITIIIKRIFLLSFRKKESCPGRRYYEKD